MLLLHSPAEVHETLNKFIRLFIRVRMWVYYAETAVQLEQAGKESRAYMGEFVVEQEHNRGKAVCDIGKGLSSITVRGCRLRSMEKCVRTFLV